uniref:S28-RNase n=1 Tax=Pyrus x bretschneideri TaxID=225117 RepID=B0G0V5_9ROSA|nr:S28-RNase [Pyrus x bretschneideri]
MGITGMIYMVTMVFSLIVLILSSSKAQQYDYFRFTQQYQPAVCNSNPTPCKDSPDKLFTVHGLWPSNSSGPHPHNCTNTTVKSQTIRSLKAQLEIIWPNVLNRNDHVGFWSRQWGKHGTCASPALKSDMQYFQTVINMYTTQKQNVSRILSKANIKPNGTTKALTDIQNAIRNGNNNTMPKLKCKNNSGIPELVEVSFCSDSNLTRFINCPHPFLPGSPYFCPGHVQY